MLALLCTFYRSTIGKKIIVALTGLAMLLWLLGHLAGNLQVFAGAGPTPQETLINQYAAMLHHNVALLWFVRITMFAVIFLHIFFTIQLTHINDQARPKAYRTKKSAASTLASRTMIFGGVTVLVYIVYHLLHLTFGRAHPELFTPGDIYGNMINSFQIPSISIAYLVGQAALFMHLYHGAQSIPRTLGIHQKKYLNVFSLFGTAIAFFIFLGFSSIPIAVWMGCLS